MMSHKRERVILEGILDRVRALLRSSGNSGHINHSEGVIRGLVWAYIGQDPGIMRNTDEISKIVGREIMGKEDKPDEIHWSELGKLDYSMRIDCAAIKDPDGKVWTGKRHGHVVRTIVQATGVKQVGWGYEQGFVTQSGEFVDRKEAERRALASGQLRPQDVDGDELYSEDLY
jgi:hypothetical protein